MIQNQKRERRDWTLLIFIIPLGILLILIVGQIAIRLVPLWSVNGDMNSNLEPDPDSPRPFALLQPILPQILIPMEWMEYYLTPGAEINFPPFLTFSPTASPPPTEATPTATESAPTQVTPTETPSPTNSPAATSTTASPTETEDPGGGGGGGGGSSTPPTSSATPTDISTGYPSTIDPTVYGTTPAPVPTEIGVTPDNDPTGSPSDNGVGSIADGTYIVISLRITVEATPDNNYDLVFYEYNYENNGYLLLDWIIIGITNDDDLTDGMTYYEVFNWGEDQSADTNSNISDYSTDGNGEMDDEQINTADLYDPDGAGAAPQTGILIDVDTASSDPPPSTYDFVVIISPPDIPPAIEGYAQVDAIQATEVPIPPTP